MRSVVVATIALMLLAAPGGWRAGAQVQNVPSVLTRMEQAARALKSLEASLRQEKTDKTLGVTVRSSGQLYYKAGPQHDERILVVFTEPSPESISVIGDKVVIYQPAIQQAFLTTRQGTANKNKSLNFLSLGYGEAAGQLKDRYNITVIGDDPINGRPATMVQLDPRASNDGVKAIQLWIDNQTWLPVQYHLLEKGARTIITLGGMKPNVALSDNKFEIDLPKNVKVVKG